MKKIYVLFAFILIGIRSSSAQCFWHPDLGTPRSGSVPLEWDTRRYMFEATDGEEFGSAGAIWESLNEQFRSAGITWISVNSVENPADGAYEIWFDLEENEDATRSIHLGYSYGPYFIITQKGRNDRAFVDIPAGGTFVTFPGVPLTLNIRNTAANHTYDILQHYSDDTNDIFDTFVGASGTVEYTGVFNPGRYSISDAPDDIFNIVYEDTFNYFYGISEEVVSIDPDGGIYTFYFKTFTPQNGSTSYIYGEEEIDFLNDAFTVFNSGKSTYWNPHMKLSCGYDYDLESAYIQVTCPPNITGKYIRNNTCLLVGDDMRLEINQDKGGGFRHRNVTYTVDKGSSKIRAEVDRAQVGVVYTLYRNNKEIETRSGRGENLTLLSDMIPGYYKVIASYNNQTMTLASKQFFTGMADLPEDRNWICVQTYNDMDASCDLTYYDGLGYPTQVLQVAASDGGRKDIVQPIVYDALSREEYKYLPYSQTDNHAQYVNGALEKQNSYYLNKYNIKNRESAYAYTHDTYEASPLNRILRSRNAGAEFQSDEHSVDNGYLGNEATAILRLDVDRTTNELVANGYYDVKTLSGIRTEDEDGAVTVVFYDERDRAIYEDRQLRNRNDIEHLITRYVYDDCGRLAWCVTPKGTDLLADSQRYRLSDDFTKQNCYAYVYDGFDRTVEKHIPGQEPVYMVYDSADRLVMQQDGNLRAGVYSDRKPQWMIYEYDVLGRQTEQAIVTDTSLTANTRKALQEQFDAGQVPALYENASMQLLHRHNYDSYAERPGTIPFLAIDGWTTEIVNGQKQTLLDDRVRGLLTYERLAVLTDNGIGGYHDRAYYYDYKGRVIQIVASDPDGNVHRITNKYDFTGNLSAQRESYTHDGTTDVLNRTFEYDPRNRMTKETAQFNNGEQAVVAYTYDELGQLTGKTYGTGVHAIHETTDYNLQGWITEKSNELFEMKLRYHDPEPYYGGDAYYTGNISEWWWQHKNVNGSYDADNNTYIFHYDDLSRLNESRLTYNESEDITDEFVERDITYDKNSNILTLNRSSLSSEDARNYLFSYIGNQRVKEINNNSTYSYDANGNISSDALSGLEISYNHLNLPSKMYGWGDYSDYYRYLADGTKILHEFKDGEQDNYIGSLVYYSNGEFSMPFSGGRLVSEGNTTEAHYFLIDHLGSTRVVAKVTPTGRIDLDRKDYYPFGKEWRQSGMPTSSNRYTFSGKERQDIESDDCVTTPLYDFGARFYDPDSGMWLQQDPILQFPSLYTYCADNPINFIDPFGLDVWTTNDPAMIARFIDEYTRTGNAPMSGWKYFTDEQFFNQNQETTPYMRKDKKGNYFFTYNTIEDDEVVVNSLKLPKYERGFWWTDEESENLDIFNTIGRFSSHLGIFAGIGNELMYSKTFGTWMGKDWKIRSQKWGGNGITGGKLKYAAKVSKYFKWLGYGTAFISAVNTEMMYDDSQISNKQRWISHCSTAISCIPLYGTAWSIGWEAGQLVREQ